MNAKQVGLAVAAIGVAGFLALAPRPDGMTRAQQVHTCDQLVREGKKAAEQNGGQFPADAAREQCLSADFKTVPERSPAPMTPSPGCKTLEPIDPLPARSVAAPSAPIPYFAPTTGQLPADGPAVVGGVALPRGSRCPGYWATDDVVDKPLALAAELAAQFPRTGLWPMIWDHDGEGPDGYHMSVTDPAIAERLDVLAALQNENLEPIAALANGSGRVTRSDANPFADMASQVRRPRAVLLLVPVNRPADVPALLGGLIATEYYSDAQLTAVTRSWEERFGAVPTVIGLGGLAMHVQAPPRDADQARVLAGELRAFAPDDPEEEAVLTRSILAGKPWSFGWMD